MTRAVRPNAEAEEEFRYYIRWYENESVGLGDRLWSEIQAAIDLISGHPSIGEAVRRVHVRGAIRRVPLRDRRSGAYEPKANLLAQPSEVGANPGSISHLSGVFRDRRTRAGIGGSLPKNALDRAGRVRVTCLLDAIGKTTWPRQRHTVSPPNRP